ncbi:MAG: hypothetical protein ACLFPD_00465 [Desulfosudaceae bacterium]
MKKWMRHSTVLIVTITLLVAPMAAIAAEEVGESNVGAGAIAGDIVLARPLGIAATALGTSLFFASLPFSALGGNTGAAAKALVADPVKFTFFRPLGRF